MSSAETRVEFPVMEFQDNGHFQEVDYCYQGSEQVGWQIYRNQEKWLTLPSGYKLLKTMACGICSTDLARANLPFVLPQVTGHEVVAQDGNQLVVVEINASHWARGSASDCYYCQHGLANHCPERLTLGIDRLPGGFAPYLLAPKNSIIPLPKGVDAQMAVIVEPLAAALHAVKTTPIQPGDKVAVVGPRRLGALLLLALNYMRQQADLDFSITAIIRNPDLENLCQAAGADFVVLSDSIQEKSFDVVFDTSGSLSGFDAALSLSKKIVHLKSTNGQSYHDLKILTRLVIDEISIQPLSRESLEQLNDKNLLMDSRLKNKFPNLAALAAIYDDKSIPRCLNEPGQYDALLVADLLDLNELLQPADDKPYLKPTGHVYYYPVNEVASSPLALEISQHHVRLLTSRCGDFRSALVMMQQFQTQLKQFLSLFLTHRFSVRQLDDAFELARNDKQMVKGVVEHDVSINNP